MGINLNMHMRAHELLCEQSHEDLARDALITLLTTQHAMGIPEITTKQLSKSLEDRNFFVDTAWIWEQAQKLDIVDKEKSDQKHLTLKLPDQSDDDLEDLDAAVPDQESDAEKKVDQLAAQALDKRI